MDWGEDGYIYYFRGQTIGSLWRISEQGGDPEPVPIIGEEVGPTPRMGLRRYPPGRTGGRDDALPGGDERRQRRVPWSPWTW